MPRLEIFLAVAGVLHFGILIASALVPGVLDWKRQLAGLDRLLRQIIWVHGAYIVLMIVGIGALSLVLADDLAARTPLARAVCGFVALFWGVRLVLQFGLFDPREHLKHIVLKLGYHGLTVTFLYFVAVYGWAALGPAA